MSNSNLFYGGNSIPKEFDHSSYLGLVRNDVFVEVFAQCVVKIKTDLPDFDSIAVTGISGMLLGPQLARELGKNLIVVRKDQDTKNHAFGAIVLGYRASKRYLIVDDQISSGNTCRDIVTKIWKWAPEARPIGGLMYIGPHFLTAPYNNYMGEDMFSPRSEDSDTIETDVSLPVESKSKSDAGGMSI